MCVREPAQAVPGCPGMETMHGANGSGITISCRQGLEDIACRKVHPGHAEAQRRGRSEWHENYSLHICMVERETFRK